MKIKYNWQRDLIGCLLAGLQGLFFGIIFLIYRRYFELPLWSIILFLILALLCWYTEPLSASEKIFKKFCNRECEKCNQWHCEVSEINTKDCAK